MIKRSFIIAIVFVIIDFLNVSAEILGNEIPLRFDGFNCRYYNVEYPWLSKGFVGSIDGSYYDTSIFKAETNVDLSYDSLFSANVRTGLGLSSNSYLLNRPVDDNSNLKHNENFFSSLHFRNSGFKLFVSYRFIENFDGYTDWANENLIKTTGKPVPNYVSGLVKNYLFGVAYKTDYFSSVFKTNSYSKWYITSGTFIPINSNGTELSSNSMFYFPKSILNTFVSFDVHDDYLFNDIKTEFEDYHLFADWKGSFLSGMEHGLRVDLDSRKKTGLSVNAFISDTISDFLRYEFTGKLYGNMEPGFISDIRFVKFPNVTISGKFAWDFTTAERDYSYMTSSDTAYYKSLEYRNLNAHVAVGYHDTLFFPLNLKIWYDYNQNPVWETIDYKYSKAFVSDEFINNPLHSSVGGRGNYEIVYKKAGLNLWGYSALSLKNGERQLMLPRLIGADIFYGKRKKDSFYAEISVRNRDAFSLNSYNHYYNKIVRRRGDAVTYMMVSMNVPLKIVNSPSAKLKTILELNAGPIYFSDEQFYIEGATGTQTGPVLSLNLVGLYK